MSWFSRKEPPLFAQLAAVQRLLLAQNLDEVRDVLVESMEMKQVLWYRRLLQAFKRFRTIARAQDDQAMIRQLDTLERIVESARRMGSVDAAIQAEKQDTEQVFRAVEAVFAAMPWDLEQVVQQQLSVLSRPRVPAALREYNARVMSQDQEQAGEGAMSQARRELRELKVQYVEDAVRRGVSFAEHGFKARFQAFAVKYGQQWQ